MIPIYFTLTIILKFCFKNANDELEKISQWFKANKLSLNEGRTKFTLFHIPRDKDNLPLQLLNLKINDNEIKRSSSIKTTIKNRLINLENLVLFSN